MICKNPYYNEGVPYGCGQCMPCRINRKRLWTHRIMLECLSHPYNAFVTLTYDEDHVPSDFGLVPEHLQKWLKRIRKRVEPSRLRFYAVGEYGDKSGRPHYHVALFNYPPCVHGRPFIVSKKQCSCPNCQILQSTWSYGLTYLGDLNSDSAAYVANYVTKSMTKKIDERLFGRHPEFCRMSNRPGLGADSISWLVDWCKSKQGQRYIQIHGDVPSELYYGKKRRPLGRYIMSKLRESLGLDKSAPDEIIKMLREKSDQELIEHFEATGETGSSKDLFQSINKQRYLNQESIYNLKKKGRSL